MAKKSQTKKKRIEQNLKELEALVHRFEEGEIEIEEGIEEYKKAAKLIQAIKKELTSLELKIKEIQDSYE
jgi:exodeoxyribonuclease VII small subunit